MDPQSPLHPLFVHLPLGLALVAPVLFAGLWLAIQKNLLPLRTWTLAIAAQVALVGGAGLALKTGEEDAERVERVVAEARIEAHEDRAELFLGAGVAVLLLAFAPLLARGMPRAGKWAAYATIAGSVGVLALGWAVGSSGGKLVYREGAATAWTGTSGSTAAPVDASHRER